MDLIGMKDFAKYVGLILILALCSCEQNHDTSGLGQPYDDSLTTGADQNTDNVMERKLIKEGFIEFETNDLALTRNTIFKAIEKYKGYLSTDQEFKSSDRNSQTITIRIPTENFDDFIREATEGIKMFDFKEVNVKDVTEEFLDIQARVKTKKELEVRYLELLQQANNVTEILEIEREIGKLRSDIESIEGRLRYLDNLISYSTLKMTFYKTVTVQIEFFKKFKNGVRNGWNNLIWFFIFLTNIWPFILICLGVIFGIRYYRK